MGSTRSWPSEVGWPAPGARGAAGLLLQPPAPRLAMSHIGGGSRGGAWFELLFGVGGGGLSSFFWILRRVGKLDVLSG